MNTNRPVAAIDGQPHERQRPFRSPECQAGSVDCVLDCRTVETHGQLAAGGTAETDNVARGLGYERRQTFQFGRIAAASGAHQNVTHGLAECRLLRGLARSRNRHGRRVEIPD